MVFKCKMCGGDIKIIQGSSVCECEYCGSKQTLPNFDDEKKTKLFERANRLRFECEFDKASSIYESLVAEFPEEAEAYWGLLLCKYGIEYVDDPKTGDKIPTCHRLSFASVTNDDNFDNAILYGNKESRAVYTEEANKIEEIRKKIVSVSVKEEPYDVFICYKESDANGGRTEDSVLAQRIYEELVTKDYRVFFAKVSLESKIGEEYEPYIFAALNSAKVMLVVGTDYNNINSIWVRNEWSRYLDLMKRNKDKIIIPCYKDMDPYDLPKEFSGLQAQDMGKIGAIQDLIRGIGKVVSKGTENQPSRGITEDALKAAFKQEAKKRRIKTIAIVSVVSIVAAFALFAGVKALIDMIKKNKNTTIINNETVITEKAQEVTTQATTRATTEATTEATTKTPENKKWKIKLYTNAGEEDMTSDFDKFQYGTSRVYIHFDVVDGPDGEGVEIYAIIRDSTQRDPYYVNSEMTYYVGGWGRTYYQRYDLNTGNELPFVEGTRLTIEIYNKNTNELLAAKTVIIE